MATGGNGVSVESPVPPEPSPITPGAVNQSHQLTEAEETEEDKAERSSQEKYSTNIVSLSLSIRTLLK